jgi:hypothetical protein
LHPCNIEVGDGSVAGPAACPARCSALSGDGIVNDAALDVALFKAAENPGFCTCRACTAPDAEPPHFPGYVVGFFLAEGSTRVGNGTPAYADMAVASVFTQADGPCKDRLLLELAETREFPHVSSRPEDVQVYSPVFAEGLRGVVRGRGAHTKRLRPGFNRWPRAYQAQVLGAWIDGDGTVFYKSGVTVAKLYTSSYVALQQAEILCRRAGLRFSPVYVHRPDTAVQVQSRHASFAVEIRFEDTESARAVWAASVKLSGLGPLLCAKQRRRDTAALDPVTRVRQIDKWVLPVYDLRTSTAGYTCGTLRNHNTFHTGGAASSEEGLMDSFKRAKQLFKVPKVLPGQAVLSTVSGKVDSVVHDPVLGGHEIKVDGVMHYVPAARKVKVAKGDLVTPGHALSSGPSNPVELLKLTKSMSKVREYLASELIGAYQQGGGKVQRRNVETVVRAMTNLTRIDDPGDHKEYTRGDYAPLTEVQSKNLAARSAGLTPIKHTAALKPMTEVPLLQTEDFMARLNYARLETTYLEGAAQGWSSDIHGHPVPGLVHGAQFGHTPGAPAAPPAPAASRMPAPPPPFTHPVPKGPAPTVHAGWSTPARPAPAARAGSGATSALPGVNPLWRR